MKYCFGDIVVVEENLIGLIVKSYINYNSKIISHEIYVREFNCIKEYEENEIQRYMVRHKYLNEEEMDYQREATSQVIK